MPFIQKSAKILEVGARNVNGSMREVLSTHASEYIGVDLFDGPGVDIVCDVATLTETFSNKSFDVVVSTEMLEHCYAWQDALYKMASVLRQDGLLLITTRSPGFELHDYPSDHWRFSYNDFEQIFQPLGEIISIQSDMTLGWPCGIGILVKRKLEQTQLIEWKAWLDTVNVYSMEEETSLSTPNVSPPPEAMIFDQFSRYKACSDFIRQAGFVDGNSVLDVGSGPECLLGKFIPDAVMSYVDPLIPSGSGKGFITGDIFSSELDGHSFDCVAAIDVLEHVSPEYRQSFLIRMASLSKSTLILGFPTLESTAHEIDEALNNDYRAIFGLEYSWLKEHEEYGLPSLIETISELNQMGWHCQTLGHGYSPWLRKLLSFVICVWDIPSMHHIILKMSEKFNRELYQHDFRSPSYRQFLIASRTSLPVITPPEINTDIEFAEETFFGLISDANRQYFIESLRQITEHDSKVVALNKNIQEVSLWGKSEHEKINSLTMALSEKQVQLMTISDWATKELALGKNPKATEYIKINEQNARTAEHDARIAERYAKVAEQNARLAEQNAKIALCGAQCEMVTHNARVMEQNARIVAHDLMVAEHDAKVAEHDAKVAEHDAKVAEHDAMVAEHDAMVAEHDFNVSILNKKIDRLSAKIILQYEKISFLEKAIIDKQAELMNMSGWAQGMMFELNKLNASLFYRLIKLVRRSGAIIKSRLRQSVFGDVVHRVRNRIQIREKKISMESIKQSVLDNHGRLIITFPIITWKFRWQRPQHIVSLLRDNGFSVLYVAMTLSPLGRRLRNRKDVLSHLNFNELAPHVNKIWLNSRKKINVYTDPIEGDDLFNISTGLEQLISELQPKSIIYLVHFPGWGPVAEALRQKMGGSIVFDCMDDHSGFNNNSMKIVQTEEKLLKKADLVITSSNLLEDRARAINPNTIQVKNGTEFEHFTNPIRNGQLDYLCNKPIIGYFGAISDWFDMELMAYCAIQQPDWHFVLIGSTFGADLHSVDGLNNVHFLGEKPYEELPGFLAYFDVCTIPFKRIPLTLATNPVKFYEYLSAGKSVVSIELPELIAYQEDCYLARNAEEFHAQLKKAYSERNDQTKIENRLHLASENSWHARGRIILQSELFKCY